MRRKSIVLNDTPCTMFSYLRTPVLKDDSNANKNGLENRSVGNLNVAVDGEEMSVISVCPR